MLAFVQSDFIVGGSPGLVRVAASEWLAFSDASDTAAVQLRAVSDSTSGFIGAEGDLYRERLNSDLIPQLRTVYDAWRRVGSALITFASELERLQSRMGALRGHAESACSVLTAARRRAADAAADDAAHAREQSRSVGALPPGEVAPTDHYQPGAASADLKVVAAESDLRDCIADAASLTGQHAAAVEVCRVAIAIARDLRFAEPPGWLESAFDSVVDWVAENADVLRTIADVLDQISSIAGMLSFIPGMAGVSLVAGGVALAIDTGVDAATGNFSLTTVLVGAAGLVPGGKQAKAAAAEAREVGHVAAGVGAAVLDDGAAVGNVVVAMRGADDAAVAVRLVDEVPVGVDGVQNGARLVDERPVASAALTTKTPVDTANCRSDPVDVVTGAVWLAQQDLSLPGVLPLILRRVHHSTFRHGRLFGRSWASTLDQRIMRTADDGAAYVGEDGAVLHYPGAWVAAVGAAVLPTMGARRWTLTRTVDGGFEVFDPLTRQTRMFQIGDDSQTAQISAVSDPFDNTIRFEYGEDGVLQGLSHPGYLVRIAVSEGRVRAVSMMTADGPEIEVSLFSYDGRGLLTGVRNSSGLELSYSYDDDDARLAGWVDRNGLWYRYTYDADGRCVRNGGRDNALSYGFDYQPGRTAVTDSLGATEVFEYNSAQQLVLEQDALGHRTTTSFDDADRPVSRIDALGRQTEWTYDAAGAVTSVLSPDGSMVTVDRDERSLPVRVVLADGAEWVNEFDSRGSCVASVNPTGVREAFAYNDSGALIEIVDALGRWTGVDVDGAGLPVAVVGPDAGAIRIQRDAFGRISRTVDGVGAVTSTKWSVEGRKISEVDPNGAERTWEWDAEGSLLAQVDPSGAVTRFENAVWDLPVARIEPDGARYEFGYDTELRLTSVVNPLGYRWCYEYDPAGRLAAEVDFNGRRLTYRRDALGRLTAVVDADGRVTLYGYDLGGNRAFIESPDGMTVFMHDRVGRIVSAESSDVLVEFTRDLMGRVLSETCNGRTVLSSYDTFGRRCGRVLPSGLTTQWRYEPDGQAISMTTGGREMTFRYDAAGQETSRQFADGARFGFVRDDCGRVIDDTVTGPGLHRSPASRSYRYDPGGLTGVVDRARATSIRMELDEMGRVSAVGRSGADISAQGSFETYAYGGTGVVVHAESALSGSGLREYTGSLITVAGAARYGWDVDGRLTSRVGAGAAGEPETTTFTYDSGDRLGRADVPDGTTWTYSYDAFGRRIGKQQHSLAGEVVEQTVFTWDGDLVVEETRVVGEHLLSRAWDYEPGGFRPVAQSTVMPDSETVQWSFHPIVTDLVGTPTELVSADGRQVVWSSSTRSIWGGSAEIASLTGDLDCPLRFPGQFHDAETGLNYNWHRYYDPEIGRYTTADPLGLAAAFDPHSYVVNPTTWSDPWGLAPCPIKTSIDGVVPDVIYRAGAMNENGLSLRPQDQGTLSFRSSLSNPIRKSARPVFKPGERYFGVDPARLPPGSVDYDGGARGHVSVRGLDLQHFIDAFVERGKFPK